MNHQLQKLIQQILEDFNLQIENQEDFFLLVASLSSLSHSLTNIAEALLMKRSHNSLKLYPTSFIYSFTLSSILYIIVNKVREIYEN